MRKLLMIAAMASATAICSPAQAVTNLIVNGSFENGFAGFTHENAPVTEPAVIINYNSTASYGMGGAFGEPVAPNNSVTSSPDAVGTKAAYFVGDNAHDEALSQLTLLAVGHYEIGFSAYLPANGAANINDATFTGSIIGVNVANLTASAIGATQWYTFSGVADVVQRGFYRTAFTFNSFGNPAKDVVIDQVYAVATNAPATYSIPPTPTLAVPEPAVWGMFIGGLALVGGAARRRSKRLTVFA